MPIFIIWRSIELMITLVIYFDRYWKIDISNLQFDFDNFITRIIFNISLFQIIVNSNTNQKCHCGLVQTMYEKDVDFYLLDWSAICFMSVCVCIFQRNVVQKKSFPMFTYKYCMKSVGNSNLRSKTYLNKISYHQQVKAPISIYKVLDYKLFREYDDNGDKFSNIFCNKNKNLRHYSRVTTIK